MKERLSPIHVAAGLPILPFVAASILLFSATSLGAQELEEERDVHIDEVPAPVRAAIEREAAGARVVEIEAGTSNGATVYDVEIAPDDTEVEFRLSADGSLLGYENEEADDEDHDDEDHDDEDHDDEDDDDD